MNGEREGSRTESASECTVNARLAHGERTVNAHKNGKGERFRDCKSVGAHYTCMMEVLPNIATLNCFSGNPKLDSTVE